MTRDEAIAAACGIALQDGESVVIVFDGTENFHALERDYWLGCSMAPHKVTAQVSREETKDDAHYSLTRTQLVVTQLAPR